MTAIILSKHLLRGRLHVVRGFRRENPRQFDSLPAELRTVAERWLGAGEGDRAGRERLKILLTNEPA